MVGEADDAEGALGGAVPPPPPPIDEPFPPAPLEEEIFPSPPPPLVEEGGPEAPTQFPSQVRRPGRGSLSGHIPREEEGGSFSVDFGGISALRDGGVAVGIWDGAL